MSLVSGVGFGSGGAGGSGASGGSGQAFYGTGSGTYTWRCPPGVTSICVVCIGGGGGAQGSLVLTKAVAAAEVSVGKII
jgi:hypothetical protein